MNRGVDKKQNIGDVDKIQWSGRDGWEIGERGSKWEIRKQSFCMKIMILRSLWIEVEKQVNSNIKILN